MQFMSYMYCKVKYFVDHHIESFCGDVILWTLVGWFEKKNTRSEPERKVVLEDGRIKIDAKRQHLNLICSTLKLSHMQNFSSICQNM